MQNKKSFFNFNNFDKLSYNFYTSFPQKLWKTRKGIIFLTTCTVLIAMLGLCGCSSSKKTVKAESTTSEQGLISLDENQVREKLGEPTVISKTPEDNILWTYKPSWRIIPSNRDTVYVEFEKGKVIRVYKVR